jgi:hypothetical protein
MALTHKTRRQVMRRLNDLLNEVMETLWPTLLPPSEPTTPRSLGGSPRVGGSTSSSHLEADLLKVNQALRNAVSERMYCLCIYICDLMYVCTATPTARNDGEDGASPCPQCHAPRPAED